MGDEGFGLFFFVSRAGSLTLCLHAREFVGVRVRVCVRGWSVAFSPILFGGGEPYKRAGGCV